MSDGWSYSLKYEGRTIEVPSGRSVIGRSRTCDISISGPSISRRHVDLIANAGKLIVQDLGSSNGTFINGERIRGQGELNDSDKLRLGDVRLGVEIRRTIPAWTPKAEKKEQRPTRGRDIASLAPPMGALPKTIESMPQSDATISLRDIDPDELDTAVGVELDEAEREALSAGRKKEQQKREQQKKEQQKKTSPEAATSELDKDLVKEPHADAASPAPSASPEDEQQGEQVTASELPTVRAEFPKGASPHQISPARAHFLVASFERRLIAGLIDALWTVGLGITVWTATDKATLGGAAFAAIGLILCAGWAIWGTTPGKQMLGLYVCNEEGEVGVGWPAAILRLIGYLLSALTLGIGFLMVLRPSRLALHDKFSKTQVRHKISL